MVVVVVVGAPPSGSSTTKQDFEVVVVATVANWAVVAWLCQEEEYGTKYEVHRVKYSPTLGNKWLAGVYTARTTTPFQ